MESLNVRPAVNPDQSLTFTEWMAHNRVGIMVKNHPKPNVHIDVLVDTDARKNWTLFKKRLPKILDKMLEKT